MTDTNQVAEVKHPLIVQAIQDIMVAKDADGEYLYTKDELRDFIVATSLDMGLDLPERLQTIVLNFLAKLQVPEDASDQVIADTIKAYFDQNPLNPDLLASFKKLSKSGVLTDESAFTRSAQNAKAMQSVGADSTLTAPEEKAVKSGKKPKRGLS